MGAQDSFSEEATQYLLTGAGNAGAPEIFAGNSVQAYINGPAYFEALVEDLDQLGQGASPNDNRGQFLYISGYVLNWLQPNFHFRVPVHGRQVRFFDLVIEKARAGVDVRVLAWGPWSLALVGKVDLRPEPGDNMRTVAALRQDPAMQGKACLNILSHPAGSAHTKMVVLGTPEWAVGYTGGMDLSPDRAEPRWLDVQARLTGPAVQDLYNFFGDMWNQNLVFSGQRADILQPQLNGHNGHHNGKGSSNGKAPARSYWINAWQSGAYHLDQKLRSARPTFFRGRGGEMPSVLPGTPPVSAVQLPVTIRGDCLVQSLRTIPAFKYAFSPLSFRIRVAPLSFAPQGAFEVRDALRRAIEAAHHYIYIEDQYFWSTEVMRWIQHALHRSPDLRVILATGESDQLRERLIAYRTRAVYEGLLRDLPDSTWNQVLFLKRDELVHAKTVLIDDKWALIGSANIANRSYYTDIEHSIAVSDASGEWVSSYRAALWSRRLGLPEGEVSQMRSLQQALLYWDIERWGQNGTHSNGHKPTASLRRIFDDLPSLPDIDLEWYSMVEDPDSRKPWYFPLRRSYAEYMEI